MMFKPEPSMFVRVQYEWNSELPSQISTQRHIQLHMFVDHCLHLVYPEAITRKGNGNRLMV